MRSATVTSKGQITVPVEVRRKLGLTPGVKVDFWETATGDYLLRPRTGSIKDMYGCLAGLDAPKTNRELNELLSDYEAELDDATKSNARTGSDSEVV